MIIHAACGGPLTVVRIPRPTEDEVWFLDQGRWRQQQVVGEFYTPICVGCGLELSQSETEQFFQELAAQKP